MNIAQGSLEDCLYYILLAKDLGFGDTKSIRVLSVKSVASMVIIPLWL
jgi:hypothetical protein